MYMQAHQFNKFSRSNLTPARLKLDSLYEVITRVLSYKQPHVSTKYHLQKYIFGIL